MTTYRYISELPSGFVYRRRINAIPYSKFFSNRKFGSPAMALKAAITYRDEQMCSIPVTPRRHRYSELNVTGVKGVSWKLNVNRHRNNTVTNELQASWRDTLTGQLHTRSRSIARHGLWGAYYDVVSWLNELDPSIETPPGITIRFLSFISAYMERINDPTQGAINDTRDYTLEIAELRRCLKLSHVWDGNKVGNKVKELVTLE